MNKKQKIILTIISIAIFFLIYSIHFNYHFPYHIDEYHHITETIKLQQGNYTGLIFGTELGFHFFLLLLSFIFNLMTIYQFLPALWATLSALILFFIIKDKTKSFNIAILTTIFFATIRSNVNLTGLWFFTPLTFSIPFIFLYLHFFTKGIETQNKKLILASLGIMLFLIFTHSISVLFAIPILTIYSLFHLKYIKQNYKFFSIFLLIPITGILFYQQLFNLTILQTITELFQKLQFQESFSPVFIKNPLLSIYSIFGFILATIGIFTLIKSKSNLKKYSLFIIWPAITILSIIIFQITKISFLVPYQRNMYYLILSLPFLSAIGTYYLIKKIKSKTLITILLLAILTLSFYNYYQQPTEAPLYKLIDKQDFKDVQFLQELEPEKAKVIATAEISTTIFPITKNKQPVSTVFFYGDRLILDSFFINPCHVKERIAKEHNAKFALSQNEINCEGFNQIYKGKNYIYEINLAKEEI